MIKYQIENNIPPKEFQELIRLTKEETPKANLNLLSAPKAVDYYQHIRMSQHQTCFVLNDINGLK